MRILTDDETKELQRFADIRCIDDARDTIGPAILALLEERELLHRYVRASMKLDSNAMEQQRAKGYVDLRESERLASEYDNVRAEVVEALPGQFWSIGKASDAIATSATQSNPNKDE